MLEIFDTSDRRSLQRDVLKSVLEDPFSRTAILDLLHSDDLEGTDHRDVFSEVQQAALTARPYNYAESRFPDAVSEILTQGVKMNGLLSQAVERLKVHKFDRFDFPLTDLGNAERFEQAHSSEVRFDHTRGRWLLWRRGCWQVDATGEIESLIAHTVRQLYADAANLETETERKAAARWALQCESRAKMQDALSLARSRPNIRVQSTDFDRDPYLVNCPNGTLDLRRNKFRPHIHTDLLTKSLGVEYNDAARCDWWEGFLAEIFGNDAELIAFIQRSAGYCLSALADEQILWFLHGGGNNGKSTFIEILSEVLGSYHQTAPSSLLLLKREGGATPDIARLHGARFVTCQEIESGRRMAESIVKTLTGDSLVARPLYGEHVEFKPTQKVWLIANHKPIIVGTDDAIWRRVLLIPFEKQIPAEKRKPLGELLAHARREGPGILNWLVEGWTAFKAEGLQIPERVRLASKAYREESDTVQQFLQECTVEGGQVNTTELYQAFREWCGSNMSQRAFFQAIQEKGYLLQGRRPRFWQGLALPSETQ